MKKHTEEMRKITVNLPASLLQGVGESNLTETIREALELYRRKALFAKLEAVRGKVDFGMTWQEMKYDRE